MTGLIGVVLTEPTSILATTGINNTMNYQGRLLSATGAVVPDGNYNMEFRIYQDGTGTAAYNGGTFASPTGLDWSEAWLDSNSQGVTVKNGYFSVILGSLCPLAGGACTGSQAFTNTGVAWNDPTLWMSITVAGGANGTANCGATQATFYTGCTASGTADGEMLPMKGLGSSVYAESTNGITSANGLLTAAQLLQLAEPIQTASTSTNSAIGINVTSGAGNIVTLQASSADVFDVTSTGNVLFGNGAAHTISIAQSAAAGTGQALTVSGGQGGTGTGSTGGLLTLQGGAGGGTNGGGGGVTIDAGAVTGAGATGTVSVGTTNAGTLNLGNANANTTTSLKSGTGGLTVSATAAAVNGLTLSTVTSGTLTLTSAGALSLTGAGASTWSVGATHTLGLTSSDLNVSIGGVIGVTGASAGYQIGGTAATGNYLRGNSTSFVSSGIQASDIPVCTGTCSFISNQTGQQATANFNIQSAASTSVGGTIQGAASQTADLFDMVDSTGAQVARFDASGNEEQLGYVDNGYGGIGTYSNLLTFSEQMTTAPWTGVTSTLTANAAVAPDGQNDAAEIATTGTGGKDQYSTALAVGGTYTFSVWLRAVSGTTTCGIKIIGSTTAGSGTEQDNTCTTTWQRFSVTHSTAADTGVVRVVIYPGTITGTGNVYAWGAQLVNGSNVQAYVRATSSTISQSSGVISNGGVFISALNATDVPLVVQAAPAPSGNLLGIQDSTGAALFTISSTGAVTTGTYQGTAVAAQYGGTGQTTYAVGDLLYASAATTISKLSDIASGSCLTSGGVGVAPAWGSCGGGGAGDLMQVPTANTGASSNDVVPTAASINGMTINGSSNATGATALIVNQAGASGGIDAADINVTNASGTVVAGLSIKQSGGGTLTNGLTLAGTMGTAITTAGAATPSGITIQPGTATGGVGAAASLTGGTASSGAGGTATIQGGAAAAAAGSTGGVVNLTAAAGSSTSTGAAGGNVGITGGNAGGSGANNGGNITLQGGSATSTGSIGNVTVKDTTNNASAFQVQNAASEPVFDVDTTNSNLVTNPGFEAGTTGWATTGSGTGLAIAQNTTLADTYEDRASLQVTTASGTASTGATVTGFTTSLVPGAYTLTFYAMAQTSNMTTLNVTTTGGGAPACLTGQTVVTAGFTRYTCTFTGATTNITAINFIASDTTQHVFWLDAVQITSGSTVTPFSLGNVLLRGAVQNPAVFESTSNSTTAWQALNSSNNQIVNISTITYTVGSGGGSFGSWTSDTHHLSAAFSENASASYNGYIYSLGGVDSTFAPSQEAQFATVNSNGSLAGAWTATTNVPQVDGSVTALNTECNACASPITGTVDSCALAYNGFIYFIDGNDTNNVVSTNAVFYAPLNSNGTIGTWATTTGTTNMNGLTAFPGMDSSGCVEVNGYIYLIGGEDGSGTDMTQMEYAKINSNGTVGAWTIYTTSVVDSTTGVISPTMATDGTYLYCLGGWWLNGATATALTTVYSIPVSPSTGAPTATWATQANTLTTAVSSAAAATGSGNLYIAGGETNIGSTTQTNITYKATLTSGTVGTWSNISDNMPANWAWGGTTIYNNYLYAIGGTLSNAGVATVFYAQLPGGGTVTKAQGTATFDAQLLLQNSSGNNLLNVDPTTTSHEVDIGAGHAATDATATLLTLDNQASATTSDPTEVDGAMYYNASMKAFRCGQGGVWDTCENGVAATLMDSPLVGSATVTPAIGMIFISPIYIAGTMTINDFYLDVNTTALGATGDIGLYNSAGSLVLDGGAGSLTTTVGLKTVAPTQTGTARVMKPGQYYFAWLDDSATGAVEVTQMPVAGIYKDNGTISPGGVTTALPLSLTLSSITPTANISLGGVSN